MPVNVLILGEASRRVVIGALRLYRQRTDIQIFFGRQSDTLSLRLFLKPFPNVKVVDLIRAADERFIENLKQLSSQIGGFTILPTDEVYLRLILQNRADLHAHGVTIKCPDLDTYLLLSEKESFVKLCRQYQIETPPSVDFPLEFEHPFVVKPQKQLFQANVLPYPYLVENKKAFKQLQHRKIDPSLHFCQYYIIGPSIYYSAIYNKGTKVVHFTQINTHQQPNGKSIFKACPGEISHELMRKIDRLFEDLAWDGVMMFELKLELSTQTYYAIECNPRLWGPNQLCSDNGFDFFSPLLNIPSEVKPLANSQHGYLWLNGYLSGLFIGLLTKTKFQIFKPQTPTKIYYRSVWLRKDTWPFFFLETLTILVEYIPKLLRKKK
jgi:hypothetical protein